VRLQAWKALGVLLGLTEGMTKLGILKGLVGGRGGDDENEEHDAKRMGLEMPLKTASMGLIRDGYLAGFCGYGRWYRIFFIRTGER
jgi:hypothetical protein